jgi:hypothetical protein
MKELSPAVAAFLGLLIFFGGVTLSIWVIYFLIKVAEHVHAWPF